MMTLPNYETLDFVHASNPHRAKGTEAIPQV